MITHHGANDSEQGLLGKVNEGFTPFQLIEAERMVIPMKNKSAMPVLAAYQGTQRPSFLTQTVVALCAVVFFIPNSMVASETGLSKRDVKFVKHEIANGTEKVKLAKLGGERAESSEVRAFAELVFRSHTKANEEMAILAKSKGVEISSENRTAQALIFQRLEKSSGADFDKAFVSDMISSHKQTLSEYEELSKETRDNDLKARVDQLIPDLKAHLTRAEQLDTNSPSIGTTEPTYTDIKKRDRDNKTMTPLDQGNSKADVQITAQIRKAIVANDNMSVIAQKVKIITLNGRVTLRGPVNSADEKRVIGEIASRTVHSDHLDNQLDFKSANGTN